MNGDGAEPYEPPSSDTQTDNVQVGTKKVANKRVCAFLIDNLVAGIAGYILWILDLGYLLFRDALFGGGRSIGKYIVGLRVVDMEGQPCNLRRSGLRNLLFMVASGVLIVVNSFELVGGGANIPPYVRLLVVIVLSIYLVEYFGMRFSKEQRRWGDRMARTIVQDIKPDRPDWWFFLFSILIAVVTSVVFATLGSLSDVLPALPEG